MAVQRPTAPMLQKLDLSAQRTSDPAFLGHGVFRETRVAPAGYRGVREDLGRMREVALRGVNKRKRLFTSTIISVKQTNPLMFGILAFVI
jgi:hypothetical protein